MAAMRCCADTGERASSNSADPLGAPNRADRPHRRLQIDTANFDVREFVECTAAELASSATSIFAPFIGSGAESLAAALDTVSLSLETFRGCPDGKPDVATVQAMLNGAVDRILEATEQTIANRVGTTEERETAICDQSSTFCW